MTFEIKNLNCLEGMAQMAVESVHAVVTDPPYGLSFMGKGWDHSVPGPEYWRECLRVLKPGGYLLAFAGTRTQHRMASAIEDAGFEIRDMIAWTYSTGFPKGGQVVPGWSSTLKPALEPITVARKPFAGSLKANFQAHGTGALNIDGCRIATNPDEDLSRRCNVSLGSSGHGIYGKGSGAYVSPGHEAGRWPANLVHDGSDEVLACFPETAPSVGEFSETQVHTTLGHADEGGSVARFFYSAKAGKQDRAHGNNHPTVKPQALMRWLVRLATPPGGMVLDPFVGSGSTGVAALAEGINFVGFELDVAYYEIACRRLQAAREEEDR